MTTRWHAQGVSEVAASLATDPVRGLTADEAARRLAQDGPNELRRGEAVSPLTILLRQFGSLVIWVLIGAAVVSVALGEWVDGGAIIAIVVLNGIIGFFQEYRAEQAVAAGTRRRGLLVLWIGRTLRLETPGTVRITTHPTAAPGNGASRTPRSFTRRRRRRVGNQKCDA